MGLMAVFGGSRVFIFLIATVTVLWFIIVNNPGIRQQTTTYLLGALIVIAALPFLRRVGG